MNRFFKNSSLLRVACFYILGVAAYLAFYTVIGAPLATNDSLTYLQLAKTPWAHRGQWFPIGLPLLLYFTQVLGLPVKFLLALLATTRIFLIHWFLRSVFPRGWALLLMLLFVGPDWLQLDSTLWTELPFIVFALALAWSLHTSDEKMGKSLIRSLLIFAGLYLTRHAGLFMLPAFLLAFVTAYFRKVSGKSLGLALALIVVSWAALNLSLSGRWTSSTRAVPSCKFGLISLHEFPYCDGYPASLSCGLDPHREVLHDPKYFGFAGLMKLHMGAPPYPRLAAHFGEATVCQEYHNVVRNILLHQKLRFSLFLLKRIFAQIGPWEVSELGGPQEMPKSGTAIRDFNNALTYWNMGQFALAIFCVATFVWYLSRPRLWQPGLVFLWLAGFGHAAGIALSNPFLALRYQAMHKCLLLLAAILSFAKLRTGNK